MSIVELFRAGGPVMYPLAACSIAAVAIVIERAVNLRAARVLDPKIVERVTGLVEGGRPDKAIEVCRQNPGIFTDLVLAGLEQARKGEAAAKEAVEDTGRQETARLTRYLGLLGTIVGISPLLGLLGTVTGMIDVFGMIAQVGTGQAAQLSSGISEALITTAAGLFIAIPSLLAYNVYSERAERIIYDIERETLRVLRGLYPTEPQPVAVEESASVLGVGERRSAR